MCVSCGPIGCCLATKFLNLNNKYDPNYTNNNTKKSLKLLGCSEQVHFVCAQIARPALAISPIACSITKTAVPGISSYNTIVLWLALLLSLISHCEQ